MKKTKLSLAVAGLVFAAGLIFTGCPKPTDGGSTVTHDENAKATDLIRFNLSGAKALGTALTSSEQLVKYDEDGEAESVIEDVIPEQKINYSTLEKILEIKKNPYSTVVDVAKGTYVLFKEPNNKIKYTDGSAAPSLGQLIYAKTDGSIVDISGQGVIHPQDDRDYIEFANSGKAYFRIWEKEENSDKYYEHIKCFDPSTGATTAIFDNSSSKFDIDDFRIKEDGSWMFITAYDKTKEFTNNEVLHVYALATANPSAKKELFTQPTGIKATAGKLGYDPASKNMFVKINDDQYDVLFGQRVYEWDNGYSATNGYNAQRIHEYFIPTWYVEYKNACNMEEDAVFEKIATNIKNQCGLAYNDYNGDGSGSSADIEINLSFFKDKAEYSNLYDADAKDGAAIKILFENMYTQGFDGYTKEPGKDRVGNYTRDTDSQFYNFLKTYGAFNGEDHMLIYPLDKLCFLKASNGNATEIEHINEYRGVEFTELVSTNYGSWCIGPMGGWDSSIPEFGYLNQLSDSKGKLLMTIPESMQREDGWIDFNNWGGYWGWTPEEAGATADNPILYHFPFAASEEGVALVALGRKDIIYVDAKTTQARKLLKDKDVSKIDFIYTISCENDKVFFTAKTTDGNWLNGGINLDGDSLFTFKETGLLSSIVGM